MLMDNVVFRNCFLLVCIGGLLALWGQEPATPARAVAQPPTLSKALDKKLTPSQKRGIANASKLIDAALREQMQKLQKRVVNLLTVGPSAPNLESATIREMADVFSKVRVRSVSDFEKADELVSVWRKNLGDPPKELLPVLALGDLTIVQWLEPGPAGLVLNTWYVAKDKVLGRDEFAWGDGTLPQETIDKLHRVILSPELKVDG